MQTLKVALVQAYLHWEDKKANLDMFNHKLEGIAEEVDIMVLPEMFATGFSMTPEGLEETMDGSIVAWMKSISVKKNAAITGSLIVKENGNYYNRLIWVQPDGTIHTYDKHHLFSMTGEEKVYTPGNEKLVIDWRGWKICPMICFDLRFPVWIRNVEMYDALIFVANWPERRVQHWRKLLQARAIENQCFVVGVNRVGADGNGITHTGNSMFVDQLGEIQLEIEDIEDIKIVEFNRDALTHTRRYMQFLKEMDSFDLKV